MKKVARLEWIEKVFGPDLVNPYVLCQTWADIRRAVAHFEDERKTWGVRTDYVNGQVQGYQLPFVHHGSLPEAQKVWEEYEGKLIYIVCENVLRRRLSAVGIKLDSDHVLFEWNDKEAEISQRAMYKRPENLQRLVVGPGGYELVWDSSFIRCVPPEYTSWWRFDEIYDVMVHTDVDEATFTVREDGKLIVW